MYFEYHLILDALTYPSSFDMPGFEYRHHVVSWKSKSDVYSDLLLPQYQRPFYPLNLNRPVGHYPQ